MGKAVPELATLNNPAAAGEAPRAGAAGRAGPYAGILDTIGATPAVRINNLAPDHVELYVKLESFNPMGSVKDRLALGVIEHAERTGALRPGQTVIEATSGNTGIGLAMVCAQKGYPLVVVMAENFSVERRRLMRFLGARVILTPAAGKGSAMLAKAAELAQAHGWFLCRQFENEANADIHSRTTAKEILNDFAGRRLDYWVTGFGTGGTLKGVARVLKQERPDTRIMVCEPDNAPLLGSGLAQPRGGDGSPAGSHPAFRPHLMQGWSPDFVSPLVEDSAAARLIDQIVPVSGADALHQARELARREGILAGITGGATFAGALQVCQGAPAGSVVLCMLPDTGERYLSTPLFENIQADMNEEELEISRSTPGARFDSARPAAAAAVDSRPPADAEAESVFRQAVDDPDQPVVMFALEWCEFSWSIRKLFTRCKVPYRSVDLDAVAYQPADLGGRIRAALRARTGIDTIPQIFVGGEFVGGCTEVLDAWKQGSFQELLRRHGVEFESPDLDPYEFFPQWIQPR
ncbi:MAG TPA: pyridoxal-phosphate dependent enzyme [Arenicellales bacterium]|nr:pyridoxal-phosphate dependent enzyme [Arenicellales bacterium]